MNPFYRSKVTDDLLSAYIDGDVTDEERNLVERAVQADATIAWRLESLQQTVNLLHALPEVSLPRSFMLTEADVAPLQAQTPPLIAAVRRVPKQRTVEPESNGFWQSFIDFLQGGSPLLRNMAGAGLAVWLVLFGATLLNPNQILMNASVQTETVETLSVATEQPAENAVQAVAIAQPTAEVISTATEIPQTQNADQPDVAVQQPVQQMQTEQYNAASQPAQEAPLAAERAAADEPIMVPAMGGAVDNSQPQVAANADPLAEAMGDTGIGGIDAASADHSLTITLNEPAEGEAITAAAAPLAMKVAAENTVSETAVENFASAQPAADENSGAATASVQSEEQQPAEQTQTSVEPSNQLAAPVAAAPVQQAEPEVPAESSDSAPNQEIATQEIETQEITSQEIVNQESQEEARHSEMEPANVAVAEVAVAQPAENAAPVEVQNREVQPFEESTASPLIDPVRIQLAQALVALVTGVLAIFWLFSQRRTTRR